MFKGKKISVAIATYNGEAFLPLQLDSILNQTVVPDEILISDDGSADRTVEIALQYSEQFRSETGIVIRTDNPQHGIGGNFEWAIRHCTGDLIFICGQDDVWLPEKVAHVAEAFWTNPDAELVCHNLSCVDANTDPLTEWTLKAYLREADYPEREVVHLSRARYLDPVITIILIHGPGLCISRRFSKKCLPIPKTLTEDWWLQFCAVADDRAYFLNEVLTYYRIHDSACHSEFMSKGAHLRKIAKTIRSRSATTASLLHFHQAAEAYLESNGLSEADCPEAFGTLTRVQEIGQAVFDAAGKGRLTGAHAIRQLYRKDIRYRKIGKDNYYTQLLNILLVSKKTRRKEMGLEQ